MRRSFEDEVGPDGVVEVGRVGRRQRGRVAGVGPRGASRAGASRAARALARARATMASMRASSTPRPEARSAAATQALRDRRRHQRVGRGRGGRRRRFRKERRRRRVRDVRDPVHWAGRDPIEREPEDDSAPHVAPAAVERAEKPEDAQPALSVDVARSRGVPAHPEDDMVVLVEVAVRVSVFEDAVVRVEPRFAARRNGDDEEDDDSRGEWGDAHGSSHIKSRAVRASPGTSRDRAEAPRAGDVAACRSIVPDRPAGDATRAFAMYPRTRIIDDGPRKLVLRERGDFLELLSGSVILLSSASLETERLFGHIAARVVDLARPATVLVGGLGFGATVRGVLEVCGADTRVVVVEKVAAVERLVRGELADVAEHPLDDPRVSVVVGDIGETLAAAPPGEFSAVLLDVDNGPHWASFRSNARLYTKAGLAAAHSAMAPGGVFAVWSGYPADTFVAALREAGFASSIEPLVERGHVRARAYVGVRLPPGARDVPA